MPYIIHYIYNHFLHTYIHLLLIQLSYLLTFPPYLIIQTSTI
nr:MAG TPA: hypothetical protein [Herelleviridae sp.]